jgi:hypothetical protein
MILYAFLLSLNFLSSATSSSVPAYDMLNFMGGVIYKLYGIALYMLMLKNVLRFCEEISIITELYSRLKKFQRTYVF